MGNIHPQKDDITAYSSSLEATHAQLYIGMTPSQIRGIPSKIWRFMRSSFNDDLKTNNLHKDLLWPGTKNNKMRKMSGS